MKCPKCSSEIGKSPYCGCGWKRRATNSEEFHADAHIPCAVEICKASALHKVKTATGWAKFCNQHYDVYYSRQADENLSKYGMERSNGESHDQHVARMRKFVKAAFKGFSTKSMSYAAGKRE